MNVRMCGCVNVRIAFNFKKNNGYVRWKPSPLGRLGGADND